MVSKKSKKKKIFFLIGKSDMVLGKNVAIIRPLEMGRNGPVMKYENDM